MQWYARTPTRTPTTSVMAPVMTAVIPTATPTVKGSTVPMLETEATVHKYSIAIFHYTANIKCEGMQVVRMTI